MQLKYISSSCRFPCITTLKKSVSNLKLANVTAQPSGAPSLFTFYVVTSESADYVSEIEQTHAASVR